MQFIQKNNSEWITDLSIKYETTIFRKTRKLSGSRARQRALKLDTKALPTKGKINKLDVIKI